MAVKEEEAVAGQPWTQGSLLFEEDIAEVSSPFAERLLESGAIIHARTAAPEFSCAGFTHSRIWGITRNPWNPDVTVGGSSGGSGAALAAGVTTLATGSDIAGSLRIPASYNGVVAFKPPYGRVPQDAPFNLDTFCHVGPMARTVADCALLENAVAGPHPSDHVSLRPKMMLPGRFDGIAGTRIAVSVDLGDWPVDAEVEANTLVVADALRAAGAVVDQVDLKISRREVFPAVAAHLRMLFGPMVDEAAQEHGDLMTPYARAFLATLDEQAGDLTFAAMLEVEASIAKRVGAVLADYDALICPTVATTGLTAGDDYVDHGVDVGGVQLDWYFESNLTPVFNILSRCPVLAVPSGFAANGVPTGVQIVGRTYDDQTVFRVGAALERVRPWLDAPERRPVLVATGPAHLGAPEP